MSVNPKRHIFFIIFSSFLAAFSLASIVSFTDPLIASWMTFAFFYLSLFLLSLGLFSLVGLALRQKFGSGLYILDLQNSFRQAVLMSILVIVSFALLSQGMLFWWVELSLILFLASVEAFLNFKI